jgi:hypothetical protein
MSLSVGVSNASLARRVEGSGNQGNKQSRSVGANS